MIDTHFGVPIARVRVNIDAGSEVWLRDMLDSMFKDVQPATWALESGVSTGTITQDLHRYEPMHNLIRAQLPHVRDYWEALGYREGADVGPASSWANRHDLGDWTGLHNHTGGAHVHHISTVWYLDKPQGSSDIEFEDPLHLVKSMAPYHQYDDHSPYTALPAEQYDLVLFPSWLRHRTQKNTLDSARVAISVNYTGFWDLA